MSRKVETSLLFPTVNNRLPPLKKNIRGCKEVSLSVSPECKQEPDNAFTPVLQGEKGIP